MQSQPDDLSGSSVPDETNAVHKNAKKAFRKQITRSIKFKESLRMAKQATLRLVQVHHVGQAKKIFEVDHYGKQRLVEIAKTVSCNCSFASSRDLCLHSIWVMMNVLKVNEKDDILHQKSHSRDIALGLFRRKVLETAYEKRAEPVKIEANLNTRKRLNSYSEEYTVPKDAKIMPTELQFNFNEYLDNYLHAVNEALKAIIYTSVDL
ncbi:hypothetical protein ACROYT_G013918 [Oculina patagonica]